MLRTMRAAAFTVTFVAAMALVPEPARASGAPSFDGDELGTALFLGEVAVFGVIDLVFIASQRPMPIWLSIMQIAIAGVLGPLAVLDTVHTTGLKVGVGVSAVLFAGYAIYDIARYPEFRRQKLKERELERQRELCGLAIEARPRGALLQLYARL
jgi:hypothetical protein